MAVLFFCLRPNEAIVLRTAADPYQRVWRMSIADRARVTLFRKRPSLDSFEMRFSLRCGAVLAVSCLCNLLFPVDHLYWYVLHAFLLLQARQKRFPGGFKASCARRRRGKTCGRPSRLL